jgi:hypothetical protein
VLINRDELARASGDLRNVDCCRRPCPCRSVDLGHPVGATPDAAAADVGDVYKAPEDRWARDADRGALDMSALGALVYNLLSGETHRRRIRGPLRWGSCRDNGLDQGAAAGHDVRP